ncbi:hypothetical protein FGB62_1g556 [Gracilaria domingensis]|nr:hypothetical protein FGB62_1g556 [Gracilaria domingensis]
MGAAYDRREGGRRTRRSTPRGGGGASSLLEVCKQGWGVASCERTGGISGSCPECAMGPPGGRQVDAAPAALGYDAVCCNCERALCRAHVGVCSLAACAWLVAAGRAGVEPARRGGAAVPLTASCTAAARDFRQLCSRKVLRDCTGATGPANISLSNPQAPGPETKLTVPLSPLALISRALDE